MHVEISVALNFLISHLHSKLPRRRAQLFGEELARLLRARYEGHWYPERPLRGSAFRCLHIGGVLDPLLEQAARSSGLDAAEVRENVPQELRVWIDPFEVSYQIGEKGAVRVLYSEGEEEEGGEGGEEEAAAQERASQTREPVPASGEEGSRNSGFNPEARAFVPTGAGLSGSPGAADVFGGPGNPNASPPPSSSASFPKSAHPQLLTFTTASFAATKFGSTKMKKGGAGGG
ncbi:protein Tob2-like, partial [Acipenser ruthenus]|uniref:protein Tob2-like n=1 Tax=Acipenser ruthenus TaxID=7906 RepID=UPI002741424D